MSKVYRYITSLDLEMNQPSNKIIQIGACIGDLKTGDVVDKLSLYVNPEEELSNFIINLTGIQQEEVNKGLPLEKAYRELRVFHIKNNSFINPVVWGGGDTLLLREQLDLPKDDILWCFGRRWIDVKTIHVTRYLAQEKSIQGGLAKVMTKYGLRFNGKKHNALDDSINTWRLYYRLLQEYKVSE